MHPLLPWLARRPLRHLHAAGAVLGWLAYLASPSYRARLKANAALAGVSARRAAGLGGRGRQAGDGAAAAVAAAAGRPSTTPCTGRAPSWVEQALAAARG